MHGYFYLQLTKQYKIATMNTAHVLHVLSLCASIPIGAKLSSKVVPKPDTTLNSRKEQPTPPIYKPTTSSTHLMHKHFSSSSSITTHTTLKMQRGDYWLKVLRSWLTVVAVLPTNETLPIVFTERSPFALNMPPAYKRQP